MDSRNARETVLAIRNKAVFADASKDAIRVRFLRIIGISTCVLSIVRDPRRSINSIGRTDRERRGEITIWHNAHGQATCGTEYGSVHSVKYEACSLTDSTLQRTARVLSASPKPPHQDLGDNHPCNHGSRMG